MTRRTLAEWLLAALLITAAIALVHGERIAENWSQEHWEDPMFFEHVDDHVPALSDCFTAAPLWPGLYRPLTTNCYYAVGERLFGQQIEVYHAINLVLYALNGLLLYGLGRRLFRLVGSSPTTLSQEKKELEYEIMSDGKNDLVHKSSFLLLSERVKGGNFFALIASLLWVSRNAHVQVVLNTVEFQALLSVCFSLIAILLFPLSNARAPQAGWRTAACCGALALALLSKESALIVPAILLALTWLFGNVRDRQAWLHLLAPVLTVALWGVLFATLGRGVSNHQPTGFDYANALEAVAQNAVAHALDFSNILVTDAQIEADRSMSPRVAVLSSRRGVQIGALAAALLMALALLSARRPSLRSLRPALAGAAIFAAGVAPFLLFDGRLFMRYSYFGHAGLALCVAGLLFAVVQQLVAEEPTVEEERSNGRDLHAF